jgi:hypothetical protein
MAKSIEIHQGRSGHCLPAVLRRQHGPTEELEKKRANARFAN